MMLARSEIECGWVTASGTVTNLGRIRSSGPSTSRATAMLASMMSPTTRSERRAAAAGAPTRDRGSRNGAVASGTTTASTAASTACAAESSVSMSQVMASAPERSGKGRSSLSTMAAC